MLCHKRLKFKIVCGYTMKTFKFLNNIRYFQGFCMKRDHNKYIYGDFKYMYIQQNML